HRGDGEPDEEQGHELEGELEGASRRAAEIALRLEEGNDVGRKDAREANRVTPRREDAEDAERECHDDEHAGSRVRSDAVRRGPRGDAWRDRGRTDDQRDEERGVEDHREQWCTEATPGGGRALYRPELRDPRLVERREGHDRPRELVVDPSR